MIITHEHKELHRTVSKFVQDEINPHVDEWEAAGIWPAHEVLKRMGDLGLLGINKPAEYGGMGLDYSYELIFAMALGHVAYTHLRAHDTVLYFVYLLTRAQIIHYN